MLSHTAFRFIPKASPLIVLAMLASVASPQSERTDYDVDKDGLIEIRNIEDFLAIPDSFAGITLNGSSDGCPENGCIGYELVSDLDFSGLTNVRLPTPFLYQVIFEGNQYIIKNLKTPQLVNGTFGFFESVRESVIRNLRIDNIDWAAPGADYLGTLTPLLVGSTIVNVEVSGTLRGQHYTGGLAGVANNSVILGSHFTGAIYAQSGLVEASLGMGGLVGNGENTLIYASSAMGEFILNAVPERNFALGGIIGTTHTHNAIIASYADFTNIKVDLVGNLAAHSPVTIESSYSIHSADDSELVAVVEFYSKRSYQEEAVSAVEAVARADLVCPQKEVDARCNIPSLLHGWHTHLDSSGQHVWNFGGSTELPVVRRNLVFDLADNDEDGVVNLLDRFPENPAAALDFDGDNKPDVWIGACDADCQEASGFVLDDQIELPIYPEAPNDETDFKGGSFALFELWFLFGVSTLGWRIRKHI